MTASVVRSYRSVTGDVSEVRFRPADGNGTYVLALGRRPPSQSVVFYAR